MYVFMCGCLDLYMSVYIYVFMCGCLDLYMCIYIYVRCQVHDTVTSFSNSQAFSERHGHGQVHNAADMCVCAEMTLNIHWNQQCWHLGPHDTTPPGQERKMDTAARPFLSSEMTPTVDSLVLLQFFGLLLRVL